MVVIVCGTLADPGGPLALRAREGFTAPFDKGQAVVDIVIQQTLAKEGESLDRQCLHAQHTPRFHAASCAFLGPEAVRTSFPRYDALCSTCGQRCIIYASLEHLIASGGWD